MSIVPSTPSGGQHGGSPSIDPEPAPAPTQPKPRARSVRHRKRLALALGLGLPALVVMVACLAAWQITNARHHLYAGVRDLRQARAALHLNLQNGSVAVNSPARRAMVSGESEFESARSDLAPWSPILVHLGWVPRIGPELAAAPPATDAAWYSTRSALHLVDGLTPVEAAVTSHTARQKLLVRLGSALERAHPQFVSASADAERATTALRNLPSVTGNKTLMDASAELRRTVPLLTSTSHWLTVAPRVLGFEHPNRYLVLLQNPANIAPTGGMIGALDYLTLDGGSVHSDFSSVALPHQITSVAAPLPEELYSPIGYWTLLDSNWSPDFPLSARIARWFYGEDTGRWSNGVIGLLDTGIVRLLSATGPVYVPAYGEWVDAGNVEALAQRYVNSAYHGPSQAGTKDTVRKQFLGDVMHALMDRLQSLPAARWPAVGTAVQGAIATREIQIYDRRPDVESAIRASEADGSLHPTPADFLAVVDFNESDSKLNPYVRESAQYHVTVGPDRWLDSTLSIHYSVLPSPENLEGVGPAFGTQGTKHDYEDFLRVYVPPGSQLIRMSGLEPWAPLQAYGLTQFAGRFIVRERQEKTIIIHYRVPANAFGPSGFSQYRLTVRHQPGANLTSLRVAIGGRGGVTLGPQRVQSVDRVLQIDRDAALSLTLAGPLHPRVVSLPHPSGPLDPYIAFTDLRDPKHPY